MVFCLWLFHVSRNNSFGPVDKIEVRNHDDVSFSKRIEQHVRVVLAQEEMCRRFREELHGTAEAKKATPQTYAALQQGVTRPTSPPARQWKQLDSTHKVRLIDRFWSYVPFWKLFRKRRAP